MAGTLRILMVEDDAFVRQCLSRILGKSFPYVDIVATPKISEAWNLLVREEFDLVMVQ